MEWICVNGEQMKPLTPVDELLQKVQAALQSTSTADIKAGVAKEWWVCTKSASDCQIYRGQVVRVAANGPVLDWGLAWEGESPDRLLDTQVQLGSAEFAKLPMTPLQTEQLEKATCLARNHVQQKYRLLMFGIGGTASSRVELRVAGELSDYNCMIEGRNTSLKAHEDPSAQLRSRVKNNIATIKRLQQAREDFALLHPVPSHLNEDALPTAHIPVFKNKASFTEWYGTDLHHYHQHSVINCLHRARDAGRASYTPTMHTAMTVTSADVRNLMDTEEVPPEHATDSTGARVFHGINAGGIFATSAAATLAQFTPSRNTELKRAQQAGHWDGGSKKRGWTFALVLPAPGPTTSNDFTCTDLMNRNALETEVERRWTPLHRNRDILTRLNTSFMESHPVDKWTAIGDAAHQKLVPSPELIEKCRGFEDGDKDFNELDLEFASHLNTDHDANNDEFCEVDTVLPLYSVYLRQNDRDVRHLIHKKYVIDMCRSMDINDNFLTTGPEAEVSSHTASITVRRTLSPGT